MYNHKQKHEETKTPLSRAGMVRPCCQKHGSLRTLFIQYHINRSLKRTISPPYRLIVDKVANLSS